VKNSKFEDYAHEFEHVHLERTGSGVLEMRLHTEGKDLVWGLDAHEDIAGAWDAISRDPDNRVVILTGTGDTFIHEGGVYSQDPHWATPEVWKHIHNVGRRLVMSHLDVEVPIIAAVNGHATKHSEQALLCDIVIASEDALFADHAHFDHGVVPGDGIQVIWTHVIGLNRGRYFLLTGQELTARQAMEYGAVNEVLPAAEVLPRARQLAEALAKKPTVALKSTRMLLVNEIRRLMSDGVNLGLMAEGLGAAEYWPSGPEPEDGA
jgi:enoyl-CoA hydratase/carnithine racemase